MRRLAALMLVCAASLFAATPASAQSSGIKGHIWDTTCPGPCYPNMQPSPYAGKSRVAVRTLPDKVLVTRFKVEGSDFQTALDPGRYKVKVIPLPRSSCWRPDHHRVGVPADTFVSVHFYIGNRCIV